MGRQGEIGSLVADVEHVSVPSGTEPAVQ
jgi:hypothetical protein